jgi:hypothetical protein
LSRVIDSPPRLLRLRWDARRGGTNSKEYPMALQLYDVYGRISMLAIDPNEVALLSDEAQETLALLIECVDTRESAAERVRLATIKLNEASVEQVNALAAHIAANPPMSALDAHRASIKSYSENH